MQCYKFFFSLFGCMVQFELSSWLKKQKKNAQHAEYGHRINQSEHDKNTLVFFLVKLSFNVNYL